MGNVAQNVRNVKELIQQVRLHPMAAKVEDDGRYLVVSYPAGDWPSGINGVRCAYGSRKGEGKAWAHERVLARMEKDWLSSFPGYQEQQA